MEVYSFNQVCDVCAFFIVCELFLFVSAGFVLGLGFCWWGFFDRIVRFTNKIL